MNNSVFQQRRVRLKSIRGRGPNLFVAQFVGGPIINVVDCYLESAVPETKVRLQWDGVAIRFWDRFAAARRFGREGRSR